MDRWSSVLIRTLFPFRAHYRRQELDRRRFEAAHLKYACLKLASQYPEAVSFSSIKVETDVQDSLSTITPALFSSFEARYAGWLLITCYTCHVV